MLPYYGLIPKVKSIHEKATTDVKKYTRVLDDHFKKGAKFLIGDSLSIADIAVVTALAAPFQFVWDDKYRKSIQHLAKWFTAITSDETWKKNFGRAHLCVKALDFFLVEPETEEEKKAEEPAEKKKAEKPKEAPKKEAPKEKKKDDEEEEPVEKKEEKNPLDALPPSKFNLFDFKTLYVNAKDKKDALKFFWENYDPEGYSIYNVLYEKAEGEGAKLFLTSNLMNGFLQRLEHFRKYAFAVHGVYGDEPNLEVRGMWVWRGKGKPKEITDLDSYEYHQWIEMDSNNPDHRKKLEEYWIGLNEDEDVVDGLTARTVKYFK